MLTYITHLIVHAGFSDKRQILMIRVSAHARVPEAARESAV